MRIIRNIEEMAAYAGGDIGFVPTMGAFHEGHLTLMRHARTRHDSVVVSLFVNPLQFGANEDLSKYPRQEERDSVMAREVGVDILFAPIVADIYPRSPATTLQVPKLTELWEGASRPGHFDGVATVVAKLFNIVLPKTAYFGWKDLQQCLVIQRMVEDLNMAVDLEFLETVREADGLAMSSRNAYLTVEERMAAPRLFGALCAARHAIMREGPGKAEDALGASVAKLTESGFVVDYLEFVSLQDLKPQRTELTGAVIAAARLGKTRLIDNVRLL